jgi:hypothetical protein
MLVMVYFFIILAILITATIYLPISCEDRNPDTKTDDIEDIDKFPYDIEP